MKPLIIVNFKTYGQATGSNAVKLAKDCEKAGKGRVTVAVQAADVYRVSKAVRVPVFAQHVDSIAAGRNTGFTLPAAVKAAGASGTILNHAEHKLPRKTLASAIKMCKKLKLVTIVCAADKKEAAAVARMGPDYVAVEPPELIGTGVSVSAAKPEDVTGSIAAVRKVNKKIPVLCGAGVSNGEDVRKAIELGAAGVLVASAVAKAKRPENVIRSMVNAA